jgi:hypothetical protein
MSPVHIDELNPETRARVLQQIGETEGVTTALAIVEGNNHSSAYTPAEVRARSILNRMESMSAKLKTLEDDIRALWVDFENLKAGETILGCRTKKEFCERKLGRTPQAIRYLLNPALRTSKQCLPEPVENRITDAEFVNTPDADIADVPEPSKQLTPAVHKNPTVDLVKEFRQRYSSHSNVIFEKGGATRGYENPDVTVRIENVNLQKVTLKGNQKITVQMTLDQLRSVKGIVAVGSEWLKTTAEIEAFLKIFGVKP